MLTDVAPLEMKGSNLVTLKRLHPLNAGFNSLFVFGYDFVLCVFVFMYYFCSFCCHFWEVSYVSIMSREHESGAKRSLSSPPFMPTSKSNSFDLTWSLSALLADTQKQNKNKSKNKTTTPPQRTEFVHWSQPFHLHSQNQWSLFDGHSHSRWFSGGVD